MTLHELGLGGLEAASVIAANEVEVSLGKRRETVMGAHQADAMDWETAG